MIGRGEAELAKQLLKIFPGADIRGQEKLSKFVKELSSRSKKETIDLVLYEKNNPPIAFRVQDKHHYTKKFNQIDSRQKNDLENAGLIVIDIWESEFPELFKEGKISPKKLKKLLVHSRVTL